MKIEYIITDGTGYVKVTDTEGVSFSDIGEVSTKWLRSELTRIKAKYPTARVIVRDNGCDLSVA